jgi:nitrogen fixation NifU-like protein
MSSTAGPRDRQEIVEFLIECAVAPSHAGALEGADVTMVGGNPGCGDVITVYVKVDRENDRIAEATFTGEGCTISRAAASVLMEQVQGAPISDIEAMDGNDLMDLLGRDVVRSRPRCATLALSTLKGAIRRYRQVQARGASHAEERHGPGER